MKRLDGLNLVGADIVELAPHYDPTGVSSVVAAKIAREVLLMMSPLHGAEAESAAAGQTVSV